jgi:hypothetical protein
MARIGQEHSLCSSVQFFDCNDGMENAKSEESVDVDQDHQTHQTHQTGTTSERGED